MLYTQDIGQDVESITFIRVIFFSLEVGNGNIHIKIQLASVSWHINDSPQRHRIHRIRK